MRRGQQAIDECLVRLGARIGEKGVDLIGRGRQARQVEGGPANQRRLPGRRRRCETLGLEPRQHEPIDRVLAPGRVAHRGRLVSTYRLEGPVLAPLRSLVDPFLEQLDLCGVSFLPDFGGGMTSSASLLATRSISSLSLLLPGTITGSFFRSASSLRSSRSSALRALASGPWQVKQFSDRIGRMSLLKWTGSESPARAAEETGPWAKNRHTTQQAIRRAAPSDFGMMCGRTGNRGDRIRSLGSHNRGVSGEEGTKQLYYPFGGAGGSTAFPVKIADPHLLGTPSDSGSAGQRPIPTRNVSEVSVGTCLTDDRTKSPVVVKSNTARMPVAAEPFASSQRERTTDSPPAIDADTNPLSKTTHCVLIDGTN